MAIYLFVIAFICIFSIAFDGRKMDPIKKGCFYFTMLFLILLSGLRGDMGLDTVTYSNWYRNLPSIFEMTPAKYSQTRFEPLFVLICSFCKSISNEWLLPQMLFSILLNSSILLFIKRHTDSIFICILLYFVGSFYVLNCEEVRQATSFAIVLFALSYLEKGENKKYYIWVLISVGFHYSSILFLSIPILIKIVKKPFWALSIAVTLFFISSVLRENMSSIIIFFLHNSYSDYLISEIVEGTYGDEVARSLFTVIKTMVITVLLPLASFIITKSKDEDKNIFFTLLMLYIFCAIINLQILWFYRYVHILQIVAFVAIANGIGQLRKPSKNIFKKSIIICIFSLFMYSLIKNAILGYDEFYDQYRYELFIPYTLYF